MDMHAKLRLACATHRRKALAEAAHFEPPAYLYPRNAHAVGDGRCRAIGDGRCRAIGDGRCRAIGDGRHEAAMAPACALRTALGAHGRCCDLPWPKSHGRVYGHVCRHAYRHALAMCYVSLESSRRGGHFEYRHAHTRAMDTPSAMADVERPWHLRVRCEQHLGSADDAAICLGPHRDQRVRLAIHPLYACPTLYRPSPAAFYRPSPTAASIARV